MSKKAMSTAAIVAQTSSRAKDQPNRRLPPARIGASRSTAVISSGCAIVASYSWISGVESVPTTQVMSRCDS